MALKIGVFELVAKILLQYLHERVWTKIKFGLRPCMEITTYERQ